MGHRGEPNGRRVPPRRPQASTPEHTQESPELSPWHIRMNDHQRWAIVIGALLLFLLVLFPPWEAYAEGVISRRMSHASIFTGPNTPPTGLSIRVDTLRIVIHAIGIVALTVAALFILRDDEPART